MERAWGCQHGNCVGSHMGQTGGTSCKGAPHVCMLELYLFEKGQVSHTTQHHSTTAYSAFVRSFLALYTCEEALLSMRLSCESCRSPCAVPCAVCCVLTYVPCCVLCAVRCIAA